MLRRMLILSLSIFALTGCAQQENGSRGWPWWGWLILILALILVVYLIARGQPKEEPKIKSMATRIEPEPTLEVEPVEEKNLAPEPDVPDNLTMIEGIGPKIQSVLHAAGIKTFAQLAEMAPDAIKQLLTNAGLRLGVTDTWPEQARLAAEGKLDELKELQDRLTGGRAG